MPLRGVLALADWKGPQLLADVLSHAIMEAASQAIVDAAIASLAEDTRRPFRDAFHGVDRWMLQRAAYDGFREAADSIAWPSDFPQINGRVPSDSLLYAPVVRTHLEILTDLHSHDPPSR